MERRPFDTLRRALRELRLRAVASLGSWRPIPDPNGWSPRRLESDAFAREVDRLRRDYEQPALAVAVVRSEGPIRSAVAGTIVQGEPRLARTTHRFHAGSTTKTVTALLAARLVEDGLVAWDTPLSDVLTGVPMRDEYRAVTLHDLLVGASGMLLMQRSDLEPPEQVRYLHDELPARVTDPVEQRRELARYALALPPRHARGARHEYSNAGWALAGHVLETCAGVSFENLVQERVLDVLGMTSARLGGWPASPEDPDQPRGHYAGAAGLRAQPLDDVYALPAWMNPAGGLHLTIDDYGAWARELLRGLRGMGRLLTTAGYAEMLARKLSVPMNEMYLSTRTKKRLTLAYGMALVDVDGYRMYAADGSAGTFYARLVVVPSHDVAFAGFVSSGAGEPLLSRAIGSLTGLPW